MEGEYGEVWTRPLANLIPAERLLHVAGVGGVVYSYDACEVVSQFSFRRGFVEEVQLSATDLVQYGEALVRLSPLREITLYQVDADTAQLAGLPCLGGLQTLRIPCAQLDHSEWSWLAYGLFRNSHLTRLTTLELHGSPLGEAGMHILLNSRLLERLRSSPWSTTI